MILLLWTDPNPPECRAIRVRPLCVPSGTDSRRADNIREVLCKLHQQQLDMVRIEVKISMHTASNCSRNETMKQGQSWLLLI